MIALLVALSLATPASHGHKSAHGHGHGHKHKHKPVHVDRCISDAQRVQALERRIGGGGIPKAELAKLENQLESAVERARQDCPS